MCQNCDIRRRVSSKRHDCENHRQRRDRRFNEPVEATNASLEMLSVLQEFSRTISLVPILNVAIRKWYSMADTVSNNNDYLGYNVSIVVDLEPLLMGMRS